MDLKLAIESLLAALVHDCDFTVFPKSVGGSHGDTILLKTLGDGGDLVPCPHVSVQIDIWHDLKRLGFYL